MDEQKPTRMQQIIDLLAEEIEERLASKVVPSLPAGQGSTPSFNAASALPSPQAEPAAAAEPQGAAAPEAEPSAPAEAGLEEAVQDIEAGEDLLASSLWDDSERGPAEIVPSHGARLMGRLSLWLLVAIVLVNIPLNRHGLTLAKAMPDAASYIVRDGFVVKEESDQDIYVYQDGKFRWISSLDAFEHYGFTWEDVHVVPDGYLQRYEIGTPIHVLLKCDDSPHIYRLEGGEKRWIRDIDTFLAEGHVWEDVRFVSCSYLRDLPDGETIPPGSGPPPQP
jgi:hypothetical protein